MLAKVSLFKAAYGEVFFFYPLATVCLLILTHLHLKYWTLGKDILFPCLIVLSVLYLLFCFLFAVFKIIFQ